MLSQRVKTDFLKNIEDRLQWSSPLDIQPDLGKMLTLNEAQEIFPL